MSPQEVIRTKYIYKRHQDRKHFLALLARETAQQRWLCHACCLMGTHWLC